MTFEPERALELLRLGSRIPDAHFRDGQAEAIRHVVEGQGRLLVVQKTGWGSLVRRGKYQDRRFADDLVDACTSLVQEWDPQPSPRWVTCVPSLRRPNLVPDFAARLAEALELPFRAALVRTGERPEQKDMANSTQQSRNVDGSLEVNDHELLTGPVLLVDDMVDSRWTLTVSAWLLRSAGCDEVWPLVLAQTGPGK